MGCFSSKENLNQISLKSMIDYTNINNQNVIFLSKGSYIIKCVAFNIQYGIIPENNNFNTRYAPDYFLVSKNKFDFIKGLSLVDFEHTMFYYYFKLKKKLNIICTKKQKNDITQIFNLLLNNKDNLNLPYIISESKFIYNKLCSNYYELLSNINNFIEFILFDDMNIVKYKNIEIQRLYKQIKITENSKIIAVINEDITINEKDYYMYRFLETEKNQLDISIIYIIIN